LPELPRITCPALLIQGTQDGTATPEQFAAMAAAVPGARTWIVEGGGHVLHRRHATAFNRKVEEFLASVP
jgi:pimeloyl-ACP methyl ester carboxylesterase